MKLTKPNKTLSIENLTREISEPKYDMTKLLPVRKFLKVCDMTCSSEGSRLVFLNRMVLKGSTFLLSSRFGLKSHGLSAHLRQLGFLCGI